jgi:hypothetical protein
MVPNRPPRHQQKRLEDDSRRHFRVPEPAIAELDRNLGQTPSAPLDKVGHLHLKAVAVSAHGGDVDPIERPPVIGAEAGGRVASRDPQEVAGVEVSGFGDGSPIEGPVGH